MKRILPCCLILTLFVATGCTTLRKSAQTNTPSSTAQRTPEKPKKDDSPYKAYDKVITEKAQSDEGLFTLHWIDEDLYFEIPDSLMGRDMLLISRIAQTPTNLGAFISAGSKSAEQMVRWERKGKQLLLRRTSFQSVASDSLPIAKSVSANNFEPIVASFKIEALTPDSNGVVIKANDLYEKDIPALSGLSSGQRTRYRVRRLDGSRSFIDYARSYPLNVEVRHTMSYDAGSPPSAANTGTISMQMNQSMVLLSEEPMVPRFSDPRVGYFSVNQVDYGSEAQKADTRSYIARWRLEPKDPEAYLRGELVEPIKPIVYYLDPATPEQWRPYFKQGVEDWQVAFEAAGFKNAIIALEPPTSEEDPEWNPEDVRYSSVRYVASTTRNATGPRVTDPRSGEIIESDIIWYHNHIRSYRNRLMIETGAANPAARSLMIEEELIGETMRQVIAHEIGHALGLPHNMIGSSSFPVDSLRSPTFTSRYGVSPSIMDYTRQNYIAQPGDGVTRFVRKLGPYDDYSVNWGYRWYPGVTDPAQEKERLDQLILEHADDSMYRYSPQRIGLPIDPRVQTEDMGNDPVRASGYAVANLQRVVDNLVDWTATPGKDYTELNEIYSELQGLWFRYMGHVQSLVGGVYGDLKASDQEGVVYEIVPRAKQEEAMQFLIDNVFKTPTWLHNEDLLRRIEHAGAVNRTRLWQTRILNATLDASRLQRLIESELFDADQAYPLLAFMSDLKEGVWSEVDDRRPVIDTYRRNLQRGYLERMDYLMTQQPNFFNVSFFLETPVDVSQSDIPAFIRGQLRTLRSEAERGAQRATDDATRYHLEDVVARIDDMLEAD